MYYSEYNSLFLIYILANLRPAVKLHLFWQHLTHIKNNTKEDRKKE